MHAFLLIVAIHALLLGFGFLFAGWMTLLGVEADEEARIKKDYEKARQKGRLAAWLWYDRYRRSFAGVQRISAHWTERPDARKYIYAGVAFLTVAAVLGIPLGAYK